MTEVLAILGFAALFAVFGTLAHDRRPAPAGAACAAAPDCALCSERRATCPATESNHGPS